MKLRWVQKIFTGLRGWLDQPTKVFVVCLAMVFISVVLEGSLFQLWRLNQESNRIQEKINEVIALSETLNMKIEQASKLSYIDRQARDRFDLVGEDDLIFVFNESE